MTMPHTDWLVGVDKTSYPEVDPESALEMAAMQVFVAAKDWERIKAWQTQSEEDLNTATTPAEYAAARIAVDDSKEQASAAQSAYRAAEQRYNTARAAARK